MEKKVAIHYEAVAKTQKRIGELAGQEIVRAGEIRYQQAEEIRKDSKGPAVDSVFEYLKEEQCLLEEMGKGLNHIMDFIQKSAEDFQALDEAYGKEYQTE